MEINVVCGIITNSRREVLIGKRAAGGSFAGLWEFPGGKCEQGESHQQALSRELAEELAIKVQVVSALTPVIWRDVERSIHLFPYECNWCAGEPQCLVHQQLRWSSPMEWHGLSWAPADLPIVHEWLLRANGRA